VGAALSSVVDTVQVAKGFIDRGIYATCLCPFITGRGRHSADGVPKIRAAVEGWLQDNGIEYWLENCGGQVVARLGAPQA